MRSIGLPELLVMLGGAVGLSFYTFIFFILWKFYQMFEAGQIEPY